MNRASRMALAAIMCLMALAPLAVPAAASNNTTCSATLTIFTTSTGTVTNTGQVTHYQDSGVAGVYTSGFLSGYTFTGAQDIMVNQVTNGSQLQGWYTATGPGGTLTVRYTGRADLNTGAATGNFQTAGGTGQFAGFQWAGNIQAQLISLTPPTFVSSDSGECHPAF